MITYPFTRKLIKTLFNALILSALTSTTILACPKGTFPSGSSSGNCVLTTEPNATKGDAQNDSTVKTPRPAQMNQ